MFSKRFPYGSIERVENGTTKRNNIKEKVQ
jgi:hypothetical protein